MQSSLLLGSVLGLARWDERIGVWKFSDRKKCIAVGFRFNCHETLGR
jgi:hypothetical protein